MTTIQIIQAGIIVLVTILNVFLTYKNVALAYRKHQDQKPVIDITVEKLPPYQNDDEKTVLILKNVGNKDSDPNLLIILNCSWLTGISYKFNLNTESSYLAVNEEIKWKIRINDKIPPNSKITIDVLNPIDGRGWNYSEQIS